MFGGSSMWRIVGEDWSEGRDRIVRFWLISFGWIGTDSKRSIRMTVSYSAKECDVNTLEQNSKFTGLSFVHAITT